MRLGAPENVIWLWLVAALVFFLWWAFKRRQQLLQRFSQQALLAAIIRGHDPSRVWLKSVLLMMCFLFAVLALARPQWGYEIRDIQRQGVDILLVVDVSRSMLTADVKPNRLERTKLAVKDLLKELKGDRVGLIAFAGDAFLVCPLTSDYSGFVLSLDDLRPESIPRGGTNISAAVRQAIKQYDATAAKHKALVILTDGENLEEDPMPAVAKARDMGIRIFTVGVGTQDGELVQVINDKGEKNFLKDENGHFIKSRLNETLLQTIALTTGGVYVRASGAQFGLDVIYDREISKFEKRQYDSKTERRYFERFQLFVLGALLFLLAEILWPVSRRLEDA